MCTAINLHKSDHYFGRNLDLEYHYNEEVVIMPQGYHFPFRHAQSRSHYPMIGIATVIHGIPLYYDAANVHGLSMAGLNFPKYAKYYPQKNTAVNIAPFEIIPWILRHCRSVDEATVLLEGINITNVDFNDSLPTTPLHWIVSDKIRSIVIESTISGMQVHDNPIGILTNSPPFSYHLHNLCNYLNITNGSPKGDLIRSYSLKPYSNGMGGIGLPGDFSSSSRFVRAAYLLANSECGDAETECVNQFFHILDAVAHPSGSVIVNDTPEITYYSSCCNTTKGIYYYKTYENTRITAVDMRAENINADVLIRYPLRTSPDIFYEKH